MSEKLKWNTRKLPRGVFVDERGYVYVQQWHEGKRLPKKSFGRASRDSIDAAIRWSQNQKHALKTGLVKLEDQKAERWPFRYAMEQFLKHVPQWRYFATALNSFLGGYYYDDLYFKIIDGYRPFRRKQLVKQGTHYVLDSSINKELACLSAMYNAFKRLKALGKIRNVVMPKENPCLGVDRVDESHMRRKRIITPAEFRIIMTEASPRMKRRILAALNTGLRRCDVFALNKNFLDPYMQQLEGLAHKVGVSYRSPSNKVMQALYDTAPGAMVIDSVNHDREFDELRAICRERHGMQDFIFKDFRRTAGWNLWVKTKNILLCMAFLNHKKITTTQRYLGITDADLTLAGEILGNMFNSDIFSQTIPTTIPNGHKMSVENETKQIDY